MMERGSTPGGTLATHSGAMPEPMKVYELAKELGMDSLSLVDRLKSLEIAVKNHMSELSDTDVKRVRTALQTSATQDATSGAKKKSATGTAKSAAKKTVTRRAAPSASVTPEATPVSAPPVSTPVRKRAAAPVAAPVIAPPAEPSAISTTSSSTVIRRRVLSDGATQTVTSTISTTTQVEAAAQEAAAMAKAAQALEATPPADPIPTPAPMIASPEALPLPVETLSVAEPLPETSPIPEQIVATESAPEVVVPQAPAPSVLTHAKLNKPAVLTHEQTIVASPTAEMPKAQETVRTEVKKEGGKTTTSVIRRTESVITIPKDGPRKSLLRVVEVQAPTKGGLKTVSMPEKTGGFKPSTNESKFTPRGDGFKVTRVDKEGLDRMAEEEAKRRSPRGLEAIIKPEDVNFSEYRKKEMVFIPKKKKPPVGREIKHTEITVAAAHKRVVEMGDMITISDFAQQMAIKAIDIVKKLMKMGQMVSVNSSIDFDTASLVASEYQFDVKNIAFKEEEVLGEGLDSPETLEFRPPVVTIMGHVDHGKTTLLDSIREANVAAGEAGGITQHIGAYSIEKDGKLITFIDTPGHEAFTMMRARGANITDIVILVVSADDGVMPQTREALSHAKAAGVPIIVAMNKIDKPGANPDKIKQALAELDLLAEDWGGETIYVPVSALKKTNIDKLLESILLVAEVQDLKANAKVDASGVVLEARLEKGRGPVASVLVRRGTLSVGDTIVSGTSWGRVRAMMDHLGNNIKTLTPGMAAEVLGLDTVPNAGETFNAVDGEREATKLIAHRQEILREKNKTTSKASLETLFSKIDAGETKELRVILKADVFGSVEAVKDSLIKLSNEKVKIKVILAAPGGITESDVMLANASQAIIVGFNVRPETKARALAEGEKIEIKTYNIIYELIDDIKASMTGMLDKKKVEQYLGRAEVRQTFSVPKLGVIAGCSVIDGKILRNAQVRLLRESRVIFDGKLASLKRFKDDAKEVAQGYECGMGIDGYNDLKIGDIIEAYQIDLVTQQM